MCIAYITFVYPLCSGLENKHHQHLYFPRVISPLFSCSSICDTKHYSPDDDFSVVSQHHFFSWRTSLFPLLCFKYIQERKRERLMGSGSKMAHLYATTGSKNGFDRQRHSKTFIWKRDSSHVNHLLFSNSKCASIKQRHPSTPVQKWQHQYDCSSQIKVKCISQRSTSEVEENQITQSTASILNVNIHRGEI